MWAPWRTAAETPRVNTMSGLTRDGTAEPKSGDQILRRERGQGRKRFLCSADDEQDWQPYPVSPYSAESAGNTYIYTYKKASNFYFTFQPIIFQSNASFS